MPNCFIEVTNQYRWKSICAVATATCFLQTRDFMSAGLMVREGKSVLLQQNASLVNKFASKRSEIFLELFW